MLLLQTLLKQLEKIDKSKDRYSLEDLNNIKILKLYNIDSDHIELHFDLNGDLVDVE